MKYFEETGPARLVFSHLGKILTIKQYLSKRESLKSRLVSIYLTDFNAITYLSYLYYQVNYHVDNW